MVEFDATFARRLVAFAHDLVRYVDGEREADARRALVSPYSGVPNVDARALCIAAGERRTVVEAIESDRLHLAHASGLAARSFVRALGALRDAYRAQGSTAAGFVATLAHAFGFRDALDDGERATFDAIAAVATRIDDARPRERAWDPRELARELEAVARAVPASTRAAAALPLAPREPEAPRPVKRKTSHFSASSLGAYAECERRWFYRYVCASIEDRGSSASFYGTAFHWALERFHQDYPRVDGVAVDVLERTLDAHLATAFDRYRAGFPTNVEYELQRRRAKRTGRRYLAWIVERARRAPFAVIGTETTVELELDGYRFIGYVDRIDRDDATGGVTIIDYKTGNIAASADEYRRSVREFADFQLPFYYWARTAAGDRVTGLALVPLKDPSRDVAPIEIEVVPVSGPRTYDDATTGTIGLDDLERARRKMAEIAASLADAPIERFAATDDPEACTYCAYVAACSARPLRCENRFGR